MTTMTLSLRFLGQCTMSRNKKKEHGLSQSPIFADIPQETLYELEQMIEDSVVPPHTIIFRQGDPCDSYYIINAGKVRVFRKGREWDIWDVVDYVELRV